MNKNYLIKSSSRIDVLEIESLMKERDALNEIKIKGDGRKIAFLHDNSIEPVLTEFLHRKRDAKITILSSPYDDGFMDNLLEEGFLYFPNTLIFPSDVIMKKIGFGDYSFYPSLSEYFSSLPLDALEAAGAYLRAGCNGIEASKLLFIHRNTFLNRLNLFLAHTALDIRDYHNALLLELYFLLSSRS